MKHSRYGFLAEVLRKSWCHRAGNASWSLFVKTHRCKYLIKLNALGDQWEYDTCRPLSSRWYLSSAIKWIDEWKPVLIHGQSLDPLGNIFSVARWRDFPEPLFKLEKSGLKQFLSIPSYLRNWMLDFKAPSGNGWDSNLTKVALQVCVRQLAPSGTWHVKICCFNLGSYTKAAWGGMNGTEISSAINLVGDKHKLQSGIQDGTTYSWSYIQ